MKRYICVICGYVYDEAAGIPAAGIAPGTTLDHLPEDWFCPLCGASTAEFRELLDDSEPVDSLHESELNCKDLELLSDLCAGLARDCSARDLSRESDLFSRLSAGLAAVSSPPEVSLPLPRLLSGLEEALTRADRAGDMLSQLRTQKAMQVAGALLDRYRTDGSPDRIGVYLCGSCGFLSVGVQAPVLCPICKSAHSCTPIRRGR